MREKLKSALDRSRVLRFLTTGVANAAISFALLNFCFYVLGTGKIMASIISTSIALLFSFAVNRLFVFADKSETARRQFIPFVIVTVSGSLVVLNLVYVLSLRMLEGREQWIISLVHGLSGITLSPSFIDINLSTVFGAIVAIFWNYNGYRWFVFKAGQKDKRQDARSDAGRDERQDETRKLAPTVPEEL